jgi:hypothetical protein
MGLDAVSVSFLSVGVLVAVRVAAWAMAVSDVVEKNQTNQVRCETEGANNEDEFGLGNLLWFNKSLDSL